MNVFILFKVNPYISIYHSASNHTSFSLSTTTMIFWRTLLGILPGCVLWYVDVFNVIRTVCFQTISVWRMDNSHIEPGRMSIVIYFRARNYEDSMMNRHIVRQKKNNDNVAYMPLILTMYFTSISKALNRRLR